MWNHKGDVDCPLHKSEAKLTGKKQFILKKEYLDKIREEALLVSKKPALFVSFSNDAKPSWAIVEFDDFLEAYYM